MSKRLFSNLSTIVATLALSLGLIAQPTWAAAPNGELQNDAQFTCASAIDLMECIQRTNSSATATQPADIKNMSINTSSLNISSPLTAGVRYDNDLGWILDAAYAQAFYNAAVGLKMSVGPNEHRANVTLGTALTDKQQIKLTYEYLSQNLPFDFVTGAVNEWVSQNAFGAAYRYLFNYKLLHSFDLSGTYIKANSKKLSQVDMGEDELSDVNKRHIAGGEERTVMGSLTLTPFTHTSLKIGAGYSQIAYNTLYEDNQKNTTLAYTADLSQLLTSTTKITASINNTAASRNHSAKISQILPGSLEASVSGQYAVGAGELADSSSLTASLSYPAPKNYSEGGMAKVLGALKEWVKTPVVTSTRVLAIKDEQIARLVIDKNNPMPNQIVIIGKKLSPIETQRYFKFDPEIFDKVSYQVTILPTADSNAQPVPLSQLKLALTSDAYHATLSSTEGMPVRALTPGSYNVTFTANGVRKNQTVASTNSSFQLEVRQDTSLPAPTWKNNYKLPTAKGDTAYEFLLRNLIQDNTGLPEGDNYTFTLKSSNEDGSTPPNWIRLSEDKQSLISDKVPLDAQSSAPITLGVKSNVSGNSAEDQPFTITVTNIGTPPEWNGQQELAGAKYFDDSYRIDLKNNITSDGYDGSNSLEFSLVNGNTAPLPTGFTLSKEGIITGKGVLNDVNKTFYFTVQAKNTKTTFTKDQVFNITVIPNPRLEQLQPIWKSENGAEKRLPAASVRSRYSEPNTLEPVKLTSYVIPTNNVNSIPDEIKFEVTPGTCSVWLSWDATGLSGSQPPGDPDAGTCTVGTIKATSVGSNLSSEFTGKSINVGYEIRWNTEAQLVNPIYKSTDPYQIDLNGVDNQVKPYFKNGIQGDVFTFKNIRTGNILNLVTNGSINS